MRKDTLLSLTFMPFKALNGFLFLRISTKQVHKPTPGCLFKPVSQNSLAGMLHSNPADLSALQILTHLICINVLEVLRYIQVGDLPHAHHQPGSGGIRIRSQSGS